MLFLRKVGGVLVANYIAPPAFNDTYVKATTNTLDMAAHEALDNTNPVTGDAYQYCWMSNNGNPSNQRLHVDLGAAKLVPGIYYINYHNAGYNTSRGAQAFVLQGSNSSSAFGTLTYSTDTGWTTIAKTPSSMVRHTEGSNTEIWNYIAVSGTPTPYRYYAFKISSNYGDAKYMGIRRLHFLTLQ